MRFPIARVTLNTYRLRPDHFGTDFHTRFLGFRKTLWLVGVRCFRPGGLRRSFGVLFRRERRDFWSRRPRRLGGGRQAREARRVKIIACVKRFFGRQGLDILDVVTVVLAVDLSVGSGTAIWHGGLNGARFRTLPRFLPEREIPCCLCNAWFAKKKRKEEEQSHMCPGWAEPETNPSQLGKKTKIRCKKRYLD